MLDFGNMDSLSSDELEIMNYLKASPEQFVPLTDISRRAGGKRKGRETPHWATPLMPKLVEQGFLEINEKGSYRVRPETPPEQSPVAPAKRWVSPEIARILARQGGKFSGIVQT
jgi:hypothetical protein